MAHSKLASVRARYQYQCGYCGVTEVGSGDLLTVDHFDPLSAGGDDSDNNLVYACFRCNGYKSDFVPDPTKPLLHVLHPKRDNLALHFRLNPDSFLLESLTVTGAFHVKILHLNRPALVQQRRLHEEIRLLREEVELLREVVALRRAIVDLENES